MKFENKGKWLKEAQDKMAARDTMEDPDFLDGDDEVLTFEEEELDIEDNDIEEEPAQKNEAKSERAYDINFDNMGGGFTVEKVAITNGYGIELSGYSSNTSKKLTYVHPTLSNDRGKSQDEIEKNYNELNAKRIAIAKDMKAIADKFDKDVDAIFAKHGFKKA